MELIFFSIFIILIYPINILIKKSNFLPSQTGERHQNFLGKKNVPFFINRIGILKSWPAK